MYVIETEHGGAGEYVSAIDVFGPYESLEAAEGDLDRAERASKEHAPWALVECIIHELVPPPGSAS